MAITTASTSGFPIGSLGGAGLVGPAYDRYVEFALRSQPLLRGLADKRPVQPTSPGSSVVFSIHQDIDAITSANLTDGTDLSPATLKGPTTVTASLAEYGNVVSTTRQLDALSLSDVDPAVANIIAFNMADSLDKIVATKLDGITTNVTNVGGFATAAGITSANTMTGATVRRATTGLRANNAVPRWGLLFGAYIHPEVAYDLRAESGTNNFEDIRKYNDDTVGNILTGVTGIVHGAYFIETPRVTNGLTGSTPATLTSSSGTSGTNVIGFSATTGVGVGMTVTGTGVPASTTVTAVTSTTISLSANLTTGATGSYTFTATRVYNTYVVGQQALAEATAIEPHVVVGPVVDALMRNRPIGWYGLMGWTLYRPQASWLIRSTSSVRGG